MLIWPATVAGQELSWVVDEFLRELYLPKAFSWPKLGYRLNPLRVPFLGALWSGSHAGETRSAQPSDISSTASARTEFRVDRFAHRASK